MERQCKNLTKDTAKVRLRKHDVGTKFSQWLSTKYSILIPLLVKEEKIYLLFTVRSKKLRTSPGEVCFPGGKSEPGDRDEIATALREAEEEVGLQPHQVEVICRLVPYINKNGAMITPVVGFIDSSFQAQPNPHEVSEVFLVPLEFFLSPRTHYSFYSTIFGHRVLFHYFGYMDRQNQSTYQIWGLTARFALLTALIVLQKQPSFDVEYDLNDLMSSSEQYFVKIHRTVKSNL
ncbi:peroxisomal coenzyme A diphosphatase NUDT7 isoform X1 [Phascolarctos cinereus]|uniref:Peroxisomal coenzyme A diphosphatase NUDT7 n=1 Tax=Phascolarctos cinereus TaxID=38626 RepID=A0A6P5IPQ1_PHACI|nr:peroxisomal coenzyme A diphosphatase NUDT7 isoform X1 [Phascolarctos cinereus]